MRRGRGRDGPPPARGRGQHLHPHLPLLPGPEGELPLCPQEYAPVRQGVHGPVRPEEPPLRGGLRPQEEGGLEGLRAQARPKAEEEGRRPGGVGAAWLVPCRRR